EYFTRTEHAGTSSASTSTFLTDALGSTVALAGAGGELSTEYTYDPFGNTTATTPTANGFQFTGRENDGTGLYYYRARYYSPVLQRFISEDPVGFASGSVNLYGYSSNDPVNLRDPRGRNPLVAEGLLIGLDLGGPPGAVLGALVGFGSGIILG